MQDEDEDGGNESMDGGSPTAKGDHHPLTGSQVIILVLIILLIIPITMVLVFNCYDFVMFLMNGDAASLLDQAIGMRESLLLYSKSATRVFLEDLWADRIG